MLTELRKGGNCIVPQNRHYKWMVVLLACFVLFQPISTFAEYDPILTEESLDEENKPGIIEKNLSQLLINVGNWLLDVSKAQDVSVLIFQREEVLDGVEDEVLTNSSSANREAMYFGIFPNGIFKGINQFNKILTDLLPLPIMIIFVGGGLLLLVDLIRSEASRSKLKEMLLGLIFVVVMVRYGHMAWGFIVDINYVIVDSVYLGLKSAGIDVVRFTNTIWDTSQFDSLTSSKSFGVALMILAAVGMTFVLNYQYAMRIIQMGILLVMFPVVLLSAIMPSRRNILNTWFVQFSSHVFIQSGHAIALGLFFYSLANSAEISFWLIMAMLFGLPAMADVVNRLVSGFFGEGMGGGIGTSAGNMSGISGFMAIASMGKTIAGGGKHKAKSDMMESPLREDKGSSIGGKNLISPQISTSSISSEGGATSAPIGSSVQTRSDRHTSQGGSGLSALSTLAKGTASAGKKLATSNVAKAGIRGAGVIGAAGAGAIVGTMVTGKANTGALIGSQLGKPLGQAGNYVFNKAGKGIEQTGEMLRGRLDMKQGKVDNPNIYTNERLGYTDQAQLYDRQEMGRMGEELIGGKTGKAIGTAVGSIGHFMGSNFGSSETRENIVKVNERRSLGDQIAFSRANEQSAKEDVSSARLEHNHMLSQYAGHTQSGQEWEKTKQENLNKAEMNLKRHPKNEQAIVQYESAKKSMSLPHPEIQKSQANLHSREATYNKHAYESRQLEQKQANIYKINNQASSMKPLQSQVRSSGKL